MVIISAFPIEGSSRKPILLKALVGHTKDEKYPNQNNYRGDSLNEHHSIETANIIISENEIGQQNENL